MNASEALEVLCRDTHTVWQTEYGKELGAALGLPESAVPVTDFLQMEAHLTGNPKGYFPNDPDSADQTGVASLELARAAVRYYHLRHSRSLGRGFEVRENCGILSAYLLTKSGDDCPFCGAKSTMEVYDDSTDDNWTFHCRECGKEAAHSEEVKS